MIGHYNLSLKQVGCRDVVPSLVNKHAVYYDVTNSRLVLSCSNMYEYPRNIHFLLWLNIFISIGNSIVSNEIWYKHARVCFSETYKIASPKNECMQVLRF